MRSEGQRHECPYDPCGGFYPLTSAGLVAVHTVKGNGKQPCPGGGYDTRGPKLRETARLKARAHSMGL